LHFYNQNSNEDKNMTTPPFIFGTQYYRAPTPESECWTEDHRKMKALGFNTVKYWVQWRWSHREGDHFVFDDLDQLMDLAKANGLGVTLNVLFDMAPVWLYKQYPESKPISAAGEALELRTESHHQIGGSPGPCYHHPEALKARQRFLQAVVEHFRDHPALAMWDIWNEPEQGYPFRKPKMPDVLCYCGHCRTRFIEWLRTKYGSLDQLNQVWGRCYEHWDDVELPLNPSTITDFIDWREFHLDKMTAEARWRLGLVEKIDPHHIRYLHVVPNTMSLFNSVTCVDDFELAKLCQVFAATMNSGPVFSSQVVSAARGKVCYNVESHINFGAINMHQRRLDLNDLLKDWLPQIGFGIKGFLFWQYRPEVLGCESPAWGLVKPDGSDRPITEATRTFLKTISPCIPELLESYPLPAQIGIWKSRKNEIFHFCMQGELQSLANSVEGYIQTLYRNNYPFRIISGQMLEEGDLDGLKMLIMPSCYYLTQPEIDSLNRWVQKGGVLFAEAHLAGYNGTTGRHSRTIPGGGLADQWKIKEQDSTSSYHLKLDQTTAFEGQIPEDVKKALTTAGTTGGYYFPIRLTSGTFAWGANRYAVLGGEDVTIEGAFENAEACIISKSIGAGCVFYCGTHMGEGSKQDNKGLLELVRKAATVAGIATTLDIAQNENAVHVDLLTSSRCAGFAVVQNLTDQEQTITLNAGGDWHGLFSKTRWRFHDKTQVTVAPKFIDIFDINNQ
jgi:beta-galactosidase